MANIQLKRSTFECVLCNENFATKPELQEHFRGHGLKGDTSLKPQRPSENVANFSPPSTCELCGFSCTNIRSYWQHFRKFHPEWRGIDCAHCGKHFLQKSDYERHLKSHIDDTEEQVFLCVHCDSKFFSEDALRHHSQGHEQVQQLENLVKEERKQTKKKPKFLGGTFKLKASYCKLCRWQFGSSIALAQHLVTHGIFLCLTCGCELASDEMFRNHQKVHLPTMANRLPLKRKTGKVLRKKKIIEETEYDSTT